MAVEEWQTRLERKQTPNSKLQTPNKLQIPNIKTAASRGEALVGVWRSELCWCLVFGVWCFQTLFGRPLRLCRRNQNLFRLMLPQGQVVSAHFDFDRISEWREANQFDGCPDEHAHFKKAS